jgi:hypothetical protein
MNTPMPRARYNPAAMPTAAPHASAAPFFRARLVVESEGDTLTLHHFDRDPAGAIFGSLWLIGWMAGIILIARGTAWPWPTRETLILAAMVGIWLLCAFAVLAAIVQHNRLIVTGDSITYVSRVLVEGRRKTIPLAYVMEISLQEKPRRGGAYHVIVITSSTKTIHFGAGLDRQTLLDCIPLILRTRALHADSPFASGH